MPHHHTKHTVEHYSSESSSSTDSNSSLRAPITPVGTPKNSEDKSPGVAFFASVNVSNSPVVNNSNTNKNQLPSPKPKEETDSCSCWKMLLGLF